ncbi:hypothetical protein [Microbacterium excoecariae]|uniref:hypothetical protein n=1 Tax=Microbacterium excoecariae TaxID=2715210 RepID=UPI00140D69C2|nr:hypothetical protein [Microbacterium excoecariae]NHI17786.1 hypothetical protein [Microbacterium excoecariae]
MTTQRTITKLAALGVAAALAVAGLVSAAPAAAAGEARLSLFKQIENLATGSSVGDRSLWDVQAVNVDTGEVIRGQGLNGVQSELVPAGTYEISEIVTENSPGGYRFASWDCGGDVTTEPVRIITIEADEQLTCTITNEAISPTITLVKNVDGGGADPSDWTLEAQGPMSVSGASGSEAVTQQPVRIGQYTLREYGGPEGYEAGSWTCVDSATTPATAIPVDGNGAIAVELAQSITCSITNTAAYPQLSLVKEVAGPEGVPLDAATEWELSATGPTPVSGVTGSTAVTHAGIAAGVYTLAENGPAGYTASDWACVDVRTGSEMAAPGGVLTVTGDEDIECTIVNTFEGGHLTLVKRVEDSAQPPTSWELSAAGPDETISGATGSAAVTDATVVPGTYQLSETGPTAGYVTDGWVCTGSNDYVSEVAVAAGEDVTCTITNTAQTSHLTLVKEVVNTGGGAAGAEDFVLAATGSEGAITGASGSADVTFAAVEPGDYALAEASGPDGYASRGWSCVDDDTGNAFDGLSDDVVTIPDTDTSVTCTITNAWTGSTLTLVKNVTAEAGTPAAPEEWTLSAEGTAGAFSGSTGAESVTRVAVPAGSVWSLDESGGPEGYVSEGWSCTGAELVGSDATVAGSTDAVCTVTNAAVMPTLQLEKVIEGQQFRDAATPTSFLLLARGPGAAAYLGFGGTTERETAPGAYVFREVGPRGYEGTWACEAQDAGGNPIAFDPETRTATLDYGDRALCIATNRAIGPTLALAKNVEGGTLTPEDWQVSATGVGSALTGAGEVSATGVDAGVYELDESSSAEGAGDYVPGEWVCVVDDADAGDALTQSGAGTAELALRLGQVASCEITNTYDPIDVTPTPDPTTDPEPTPDPTPSPDPTPDTTTDPGTDPTPSATAVTGPESDGGSGTPGSGDAGPTSDLSPTGGSILWPALGGALVIVVAGLVIVAVARRRS